MIVYIQSELKRDQALDIWFLLLSSEQLFAVEQECRGSVVLAGDLHVSAEDALLDGDARLFYKLAYLLVKMLGE
jgi:hypothetical protein